MMISPARYGIDILDSPLWCLKQQYKDGKTREYNGNNVYPWSFGELC